MEVGRALADLEAHGVQEIYHLTHLDNLSSIAQRGILPKNALHDTPYVDISLASVQERRDELYVPVSRDSLGRPATCRAAHDMVPTFLTPRNPMMYKRKGIAPDLCWLVVDPASLCDGNHDVAFTNGNLASPKSRPFLLGYDSLDRLPWEVLRSMTWTDHPDGSVRRAAEFLVWPRIETEHIRRVEVLHPQGRSRSIEALHGQIPAKAITTQPHSFFR